MGIILGMYMKYVSKLKTIEKINHIEVIYPGYISGNIAIIGQYAYKMI